MSIENNLAEVRKNIPSDVKLIAVSKTKPVEDIQQAYDAGQRVFGENKAQELKAKYEVLPKDIEWHFIGHLQTNKIKYIAPYVSLIHGVDSLKLLKAINKEAVKNSRVIKCLLQIYIAKEDTKFGFSNEELHELLSSCEHAELSNIEICGLMGMASNTSDTEVVRNEFNSLNTLFNQVKAKYFADSTSFKELSIGMSGDYNIAIDCGSTMVRVGSAIFGARNYKL